MSTTILLAKLVKKNTESDQDFNTREKLYKASIFKHNTMVWNTITNTDHRNDFIGNEYYEIKYFKDNGSTTCFEDSYPKTPHNPYFDSGFDIFQPKDDMNSQPTTGESKSYELDEGTYLIGLGIKTAMYSSPLLRRNYLNAELFRRITIYNNIDNIVNNNINPSNINMIRRMNWSHSQTPMSYKLHPRSSIYKKSIRQANCTGIIDSGYRGELCAAVDCLSTSFGKQTDTKRQTLETNKRYFQICTANLEPFFVVLLRDDDELPSTERGEGGFGSTGQ